MYNVLAWNFSCSNFHHHWVHQKVLIMQHSGGGLSVLFLICLIYVLCRSKWQGRNWFSSHPSETYLAPCSSSHHLPLAMLPSQVKLSLSQFRLPDVASRLTLSFLMSTTFTSLFLTVLMSDRVYPEIVKDITHKFRLQTWCWDAGKCTL